MQIGERDLDVLFTPLVPLRVNSFVLFNGGDDDDDDVDVDDRLCCVVSLVVMELRRNSGISNFFLSIKPR